MASRRALDAKIVGSNPAASAKPSPADLAPALRLLDAGVRLSPGARGPRIGPVS